MHSYESYDRVEVERVSLDSWLEAHVFDDPLIELNHPHAGVTCLGAVNRCLISLANLTLIGFVIYSLHVTNNANVLEACGNSLWNYMLSRLILMCVSSFVLGSIVLATGMSFKGGNGLALCLIFIVFAYHVAFLGIGASVTSAAMKSTNCTSTLSEASFTHSPLLAELGYVFISFDCVWLFVILVVSLMGCYDFGFGT